MTKKRWPKKPKIYGPRAPPLPDYAKESQEVNKRIRKRRERLRKRHPELHGRS